MEPPIEIEVISGDDWMNGTTIWRVKYEFADRKSGGFGIAYFRTPNRYTTPTSLEIRNSIDGEERIVMGIEKLEAYFTETPKDQFCLDRYTDDSDHRKVFDLFRDEPPERPLIAD